jgi:predicted nuclease of predicted toxin-antitoxin system
LKFKIDENLPIEAAVLLRQAGFEADTVAEEHLSGADDSTVADAIDPSAYALGYFLAPLRG